MDNKNKKILITGSSGYVGAMLVDQFCDREDVEMVLGIDRENKPTIIENKNKFKFIKTDLSDDEWQKEAEDFKPDVVIHTAWQIREMYGQKEKQWKINVGAADKVFDFAFKNQSVKKIIHFSTVASYSAYPENTIEQRFYPEDSFRKSDYLYAEEKRIVEEHLKQKFEEAKKQNSHKPQIFIIRPAAITGPRGRYMRVRFGLQSALSGQLKDSKSIWHKLVSLLVSFTPITKKWARQFIHEDDICGIVETFSFKDWQGLEYEVVNAAPPGKIVLGPDMAKAVNKKAILLPPWVIRIAFFFMWNLSLGKIPTSKGGWKSYSYPIIVDGTKVTDKFGYNYSMSSLEAFTKIEGKYAKYVGSDIKN